MDKAETIAAHPDFPWLSLAEPAGIAEFLRGRGWLGPGETFTSCEKAGEGNMNLTIRVRTDRRSLVLKQARPWVEKYDHIAAPWERMLFEMRFYHRVASIDAVARRMPRLLAADEEARAMLLEDLAPAPDLTSLYDGDRLSAGEIGELAAYLGSLHAHTAAELDLQFANRHMRALNHQHIYVVPLADDNGLELEDLERGLSSAADELKADAAYRRRVAETGERYLADGRCLVHGDYFPGSWLRTAVGLRVIDPEFCHCGDAEVDVGCAVGHLALARESADVARRFVSEHARRAPDVNVDPRWVGRYAAVEVMRRLIGVAQLPLPPSRGARAALLRKSRQAMLDERWERLWE